MVSAITPIRSILPFTSGIFSYARSRKIANISLYNNLSSIASEALKESERFFPISSVFTANTLQDRPYSAPDESMGLYNFNRFFTNLNKPILNLKSKFSRVKLGGQSALSFDSLDDGQNQSSDFSTSEQDSQINNKLNTQNAHIADSKEFFMQQSLFKQLYEFLGTPKKALPPYFSNTEVAYNLN